TYFMPFLHTHTNNVVYCVATNMSTDNATVSVTVLTNPTGYTLNWTPVALSTVVYSKQSVMLTMSGTSVTGGSGSADISPYVSSGSNAYSAMITFAGANTKASTSGVWYTDYVTAGFREYNDNARKNFGNLAPIYTFAKSAQLRNGTYIDVDSGYTTVPLTCQTLTMACFQGTTTPRRNLVGYMCMDTINSAYPPNSY
ncbi:MAG: hypothetical protein HQK92_16415, partial [Nitrospirae bacterium]|nr:hypothetical protein [Nitrospirota bacterium]